MVLSYKFSYIYNLTYVEYNLTSTELCMTLLFFGCCCQVPTLALTLFFVFSKFQPLTLTLTLTLILTLTPNPHTLTHRGCFTFPPSIPTHTFTMETMEIPPHLMSIRRDRPTDPMTLPKNKSTQFSHPFCRLVG